MFERPVRLVCTVLAVMITAGTASAFEGKPAQDARSPLEAFRAGAMALRSGNGDEAAKSLQYAADLGHIASAWKLGRMYADGEGVSQDDLRAFEMFRKIVSDRADESPSSPEARYVANAFVSMGTYWLEGIPKTYVKPDPKQAFQLYHYAASYFGDPEGQYRLARMYLSGIGTAQDPRQAARWLNLASNKAHFAAQAVLGHMLFTGKDIPRQAPQGLMLLTLAKEAAGDDEPWITNLYNEVMMQANDDERAVALKLMESWLKTARR